MSLKKMFSIRQWSTHVEVAALESFLAGAWCLPCRGDFPDRIEVQHACSFVCA